MGATKSKPKDQGQRSLSLDGTIGISSSGGHYLNSGPQTQTPNRSPAVGTSRRSNTYHTNSAEHQLFGGADPTASITSPIRGNACDQKVKMKVLGHKLACTQVTMFMTWGNCTEGSDNQAVKQETQTGY